MRLKISMNLNFFFWLWTAFPRPPFDPDSEATVIAELSEALCGSDTLGIQERSEARARLDSLAAHLAGATMGDLARVVASFPLLDRDQPWLPGDGFIAYDKKGRSKMRPRSFITRDKVLLEYCRLLGQTPPEDIVAFFAEAGVDIDGGKVLGGTYTWRLPDQSRDREGADHTGGQAASGTHASGTHADHTGGQAASGTHASGTHASGTPFDPFNPPICATGPIRNLEERVRIAEEELGAVAYVPTVRKKPTEEALQRIAALEERLHNELVKENA